MGARKPVFTLRKARKDDAAALARLIDIAAEGMASYFWRLSAPDADPLVTGAARAAREEGGFSYRNALVAEHDGAVVGLLVDYRLDDPYPETDPADLPPVFRPLVALEAQAPGSWYVNVVAVDEGFRGQGLGARLLAEADRRAEEAGAAQASIIVAAQNPARRLYARCGYEEAAAAPITPYPGALHTGDWLLMVKPVGQD